MKNSIQSLDGLPVGSIRPGQTMTVDHSVTVFTVTVRHMGDVTLETIRRLLQTKYEVINVEQTDRTTYVHPSQISDFPA